MADREHRRGRRGRRSGPAGKPPSGSGKRGASAASARIKVPVAPKGPPWKVRFHPEAQKELHALKRQSVSEYEAVLAVIEKLNVLGPALRSPHQSGVKGDAGTGLRELRPTGGRTLVRPLYRRFDNVYVILSVGPEAMVDRTGFDNAVKRAQQRRDQIERSN